MKTKRLMVLFFGFLFFILSFPLSPYLSYSENLIAGFNDLPLSSYFWAEDAIVTLKDMGIIRGISPDRFAPDIPMQRKNLAVMLARTLNRLDNATISPCSEDLFPDVPSDAYYCPYVKTLKSMGIITGIPAGDDTYLFKPDKALTRAEGITVFLRSIGAPPYHPPSGDLFPDISGKWYEDYANAGALLGIVTGVPVNSDNGTTVYYFFGEDNLTRAQAVVMDYRTFFANHFKTDQDFTYNGTLDQTVLAILSGATAGINDANSRSPSRGDEPGYLNVNMVVPTAVPDDFAQNINDFKNLIQMTSSDSDYTASMIAAHKDMMVDLGNGIYGNFTNRFV